MIKQATLDPSCAVGPQHAAADFAVEIQPVNHPRSGLTIAKEPEKATPNF